MPSVKPPPQRKQVAGSSQTRVVLKQSLLLFAAVVADAIILFPSVTIRRVIDQIAQKDPSRGFLVQIVLDIEAVEDQIPFPIPES